LPSQRGFLGILREKLPGSTLGHVGNVVSRFTGGAYRHEGKSIVLIVVLAIIDAGPARSLIPWCSAYSVQIRGKPATNPLTGLYCDMLVCKEVLIHCGSKAVDIRRLAGIAPAFDEVLWQQDSSLFRSQ
jgi:hypothetical protein